MKVGILVHEKVFYPDVTIPISIFNEANSILKENASELYQLFLLSDNTKCKIKEQSVEMNTISFEKCPQVDILIVPGGGWIEEAKSSSIIKTFIEQQFDGLEHLCSVCGGSVLLAHLGYLNGKKATSHPGRFEEIKRDYKDRRINLVTEAVVEDGKIVTCGGVFKGADLVLYLLAKKLSWGFSQKIIDELRYFGYGVF